MCLSITPPRDTYLHRQYARRDAGAIEIENARSHTAPRVRLLQKCIPVSFLWGRRLRVADATRKRHSSKQFGKQAIRTANPTAKILIIGHIICIISARQDELCTILLEQQRRAALLGSLYRAAALLVRTLFLCIRLFRQAVRRRSRRCFLYKSSLTLSTENASQASKLLYRLVMQGTKRIIDSAQSRANPYP